MDNELLLFDRLEVIKTTIQTYGEENFYISFSGGKDSTVVHHLVDMALPDNKIPRVYANTGIEYTMMVEWVKKQAESDKRIQIIKPSKPIKQMLEEKGYPFKSKIHSCFVARYQKRGIKDAERGYLGLLPDRWHTRTCPDILKYQFTEENTLKISDQCCVEMKEKPLIKWGKENKKNISIIGIMQEEGGRRTKTQCLVFNNKRVTKFQPLAPITKEWENWFIEKSSIEICPLYNEPYNFERTGCKGCPFTQHLQAELDTLEKYFPTERKQCEIIWKPVYDEYRRLGYRLKKGEQLKLF